MAKSARKNFPWLHITISSREVLGPHGEHERGLGQVQVCCVFLCWTAFSRSNVKVSALGRSRPCDLICLGEGADPGQVHAYLVLVDCVILVEGHSDNFFILVQARQVAARTALIYLKKLTGYHLPLFCIRILKYFSGNKWNWSCQGIL